MKLLIAACLLHGGAVVVQAQESEETFSRIESWPNSAAHAVAVSSGGAYLAIAAADDRLRIWSLQEGYPRLESEGPAEEVHDMAFSPDGNLLATGHGDGSIGLWSTTTGKRVGDIPAHVGVVNLVAFSPNGQSVATGSSDANVRLWQVEDKRLIRTLDHRDCSVNAVAFSPDGKTLASGNSDKTVRLWSLEDGATRRTLRGHGDIVRCVAFSPDRSIVASGGSDCSVRLWRVHDGRLLHVLKGHGDWVVNLKFSPDGEVLASGSRDGTVRLWNVSEGKLLGSRQGQGDWVLGLAFTGDGGAIQYVSGDGTLRRMPVQRFWGSGAIVGLTGPSPDPPAQKVKAYAAVPTPAAPHPSPARTEEAGAAVPRPAASALPTPLKDDAADSFPRATPAGPAGGSKPAGHDLSRFAVAGGLVFLGLLLGLRPLSGRIRGDGHVLAAESRSPGPEGEASGAMAGAPAGTWTAEEFTLGLKACLKAHQADKAAGVVRRAMKAFPLTSGDDHDRSRFLYGLARLCEDGGQPELAVSIYKQFIVLDIGFEDVIERFGRLKRTPDPALGPETTEKPTGKPEMRPSLGSGTKLEATSGKIYVLEDFIGEGGMGKVFRGLDTGLNHPVAIKKLRSEIKNERRARQRFLREAMIVSELSHPFIGRIHEVVVDATGEIYLVLEYIEGSPLSLVIDEEGRLPLDRARGIMNQVCQAVEYAHRRKVLHRDLKPSNIMIGRSGFAKVMDFGLAREVKDSTSRISVREACGTLAYMAPEQHMGKTRRASDVFSLGVCLYEMLTGDLPFPGPDFIVQKERMVYKPPRSLVPELPQGIDRLIASALEPDHKRRISGSKDLFDRLCGI